MRSIVVFVTLAGNDSLCFELHNSPLCWAYHNGIVVTISVFNFFLGDDLLYLQSGKLETSVRCKIFLFLRYESKIWLSPGINNVSEP